MSTNRQTTLATVIVLAALGAGSAAQASDMGAPTPELWNGFYLGAQAGYLQGTGSDTDLCINSNDPSEPTGCLNSGSYEGISAVDLGDNDMGGVTVGGYVGYNYRIDSVVLGLEGDINWDNANGSNSILGELNYNTSVNWDASIRARLGLVVDEKALLYVTGGPSWMNTKLNSGFCGYYSAVVGIDASCGDSGTEFGWQLGAGAEYAITEHLSVKAEYLHGWYGNADLDLLKLSSGGQYLEYKLKQDLQTNVVRAGVAYHFGGF